MKAFFRYSGFIIFILIFVGCECYPVRKGIVLDDSTHLPIENAEIQFGSSSTMSDSLGRFEIYGDACDLKLTVAMDSYKSFGAVISRSRGKTGIEIDDEIMYRDSEKPRYLNSDSTTFIVARSITVNSVHFEYLGEPHGLIIYLEKSEDGF